MKTLIYNKETKSFSRSNPPYCIVGEWDAPGRPIYYVKNVDRGKEWIKEAPETGSGIHRVGRFMLDEGPYQSWDEAQDVRKNGTKKEKKVSIIMEAKKSSTGKWNFNFFTTSSPDIEKLISSLKDEAKRFGRDKIIKAINQTYNSINEANKACIELIRDAKKSPEKYINE